MPRGHRNPPPHSMGKKETTTNVYRGKFAEMYKIYAEMEKFLFVNQDIELTREACDYETWFTELLDSLSDYIEESINYAEMMKRYKNLLVREPTAPRVWFK